MSNIEHLKILKNAIIKNDALIWNSWRKENPDTIPNFANEIFENVNLEGFNFENSDISKAQFNYVNCRNTKFERVNAPYVTFNFVNLKNANLESINAPFAKFIYTNLENSRLLNANLRDSIFEKTNIKYANFENAEMIDVSIDNNPPPPTKKLRYTFFNSDDNSGVDDINEARLTELLKYSIEKKRHNQVLEQSIKANVFGKYSLIVTMIMAVVSLIVSIINFVTI